MKNPINVALYISFFPQVSMGPITKSNVFLSQMNNRHWELNTFTCGIKRFIIGLAKKATAKRKINIIFEKISQSYMPTSPEIGDAFCYIRIIKVFGCFKSKHFTKPYCQNVAKLSLKYPLYLNICM